MKKFFAKVKDWFIAHKPTKRRLIQVYAALLYNAQLKGFFTGNIYTGDTKKMCLPGLNCYSCPGAVGACPLGALQDSLAQSGTRAPAYIFGILILFGLLLGRLICGFLCPFGLIQELLYKIRTPKLRKSRFTRVLSYFKYVLLVAVIAIPIIYAGIPSFCKYVCPAGTFEGALGLLSNPNNTDFFSMLGYLFTWKFCVLVVVMVASVFIYRFFCRFICPLGAIYSLFCKISMLGVKLDKEKCIDCGLCIQGCKMDIKHVGDHECIQCGECIAVCPVQAISWKGSKIFLKNTTPLAQPAAPEGEKIPLLEIARQNGSAAVASSVATEIEKAEIAVADGAVIEETPPAEVTPAVPEAPSSEVAPPEKQKGKKLQSIKASFKKPRFVVEFVAWVVAIAVLIAALVCYNLPDKQLENVSDFSITTYSSAAAEDGGTFSLADAGKKVKVLYFWKTDSEESVAAMSTLGGLAAEIDSYANAEIVAVHVIDRHSSADFKANVQSFINEKGWNDYNIIFAQDDMKNNVYARFGGDLSVFKPITAVISASDSIAYQTDKLPERQTLEENVTKAQTDIVYGVGDLCPVFTLDRYNAEEGAKFSIAESRGKVTVLNFWYTDCDPCKAELPEFEEIYKSYNGRINMVAIHSATAASPEEVRVFLDTQSDGLGTRWGDYTLWYAQDTTALNTYRMLGGRGVWPVTVVLDKDGVIRRVFTGKTSGDALRAAIDDASAVDDGQ